MHYYLTLKVLRKVSIFVRLIFAVFIITLFFLPVFLIATENFYNNISQTYVDSYISMIQEQVNKSVNLIFKGIGDVLGDIALNKEIYAINEILQNGNKKVDNETIKVLKADMDNVILYNSFISSIYIIFDKDQYNISFSLKNKGYLKELLSEEFLKDIKQSSTTKVKAVMDKKDGMYYISIARRLQMKSSMKDIGTVVIFLDESVLSNICKSLSWNKNGINLIIDSENSIISHPEKKNIGLKYTSRITKSTSGKEFIQVSSGSLTENTTISQDLRLISLLEYRYVFKNLLKIKKEMFYVEFFILLVAFAVAFYASFYITKRIRKLKENIMKFTVYDSAVNLAREGNDEVTMLTDCYKSMVERMGTLFEENKSKQDEIRRAELKVLQAQINPHFLYNTLDAITWIARVKNEIEIDTLVTSLARLFRIALSKGETEIPVTLELEHLKSYLMIEQIIFPNKFDYELNVQDEILNSKVLKVILQPLVENSIKHGIYSKKSWGHITINGFRRSDKLIFEVIDNGLGMKEEALKNVLSIESSTLDGGYGVKNVNNRIVLQYGDEFGLRYSSVLDEWTKVEVILPYIEIKSTG